MPAYLRLIILGAIFICFGSGLSRAQSVLLNDPNQSYLLFERFSVLEVKSGTVTIDSLLRHPQAYAFRPGQKHTFRLNDQPKAYWLRLDLTNQTSQLFTLRIFLLSFNRMVLYETDGARVVNQRELTLKVTNTTDFFQHSKRIWPLHVSRGQTHTIYLYIDTIFATRLPLSAQSSGLLLRESHHEDLFYGFYSGFVLIVILYSLILFVRLGDWDNLLYAIWVFLIGCQIAYTSGQGVELSNQLHNLYFTFTPLFITCITLAHLLFLLSFLPLRQLAPGWYRVGLYFAGFFALTITAFIVLIILRQFTNTFIVSYFGILLGLLEWLFSLSVGIVAFRRGFRPALLFVIGTLVYYSSFIAYILLLVERLPFSFWTLHSGTIGSGLEILIFTLAMGNKVNLLKKRQDEAIREQLRLSEENHHLVERQKQELEQKVEQRTAELQESLTTLQSTQAQLIQKEKLASLGELTAGIAHEIQNPLNFVNNFSEVSTELVEELKSPLNPEGGIRPGEKMDMALFDDLTQNLTKITHHGGRASAIVKGMLEHSRASTGERTPTNLNALADEYLRLAYHGLRAKDKSANCQLITDFGAELPPVSVVPQEIGRVLLNLYNNAFYAVGQRVSIAGKDETYLPTVWVSTRQVNSHVEIGVSDNGMGIPDSIRDKIFQPFFTTKPTGEGTGLGLSLSYDIITKGHGGIMVVKSLEGEGAQFIIQLLCS
ncbi:sensor histidine kinase [Spirosoma fluviale]|uniref:histidine kinase n=1 Tax=Spirosoma fluviale TaxID=1597977 RepID=A0A286FZG9_9BACT|nr:7TM diverse intracellular signaling domain-containing protein [Spirosoma fluviale]SOD88608.1 His Kinase A (phospho-acceptor) domain-containing protein [Spirosoma fluviale]